MEAPRHLLLTGPPGCGKTTVADDSSNVVLSEAMPNARLAWWTVPVGGSDRPENALSRREPRARHRGPSNVSDEDEGRDKRPEGFQLFDNTATRSLSQPAPIAVYDGERGRQTEGQAKWRWHPVATWARPKALEGSTPSPSAD